MWNGDRESSIFLLCFCFSATIYNDINAVFELDKIVLVIHFSLRKAGWSPNLTSSSWNYKFSNSNYFNQQTKINFNQWGKLQNKETIKFTCFVSLLCYFRFFSFGAYVKCATNSNENMAGWVVRLPISKTNKTTKNCKETIIIPLQTTFLFQWMISFLYYWLNFVLLEELMSRWFLSFDYLIFSFRVGSNLSLFFRKCVQLAVRLGARVRSTWTSFCSRGGSSR